MMKVQTWGGAGVGLQILSFCLLVHAACAPLQAESASSADSSQKVDPRLPELSARIFRRMAGNANTWYVISVQDVKVDGSVITKKRSRAVVRGKAVAAQVIANAILAGQPRSVRYFVEWYDNQAAAEARAIGWCRYDFQAGYR